MSDRGSDQAFPPGFWGCLSAVAALLLAAILTAATFGVQQPSPLCAGLLGAGFPAPVICDATGSSPLSGVGHIGWEDVDSPSFPGIFLDLVCYSAPLWIAGLGLSVAVRRIGRQAR